MEHQNLDPNKLSDAKASLQVLQASQAKLSDLDTEVHAFYQLGNLYYDRLDFDKALFYLKKATKVFLKESQFEYYFSCKNKCLRMFIEREEPKEIANLKKELAEVQSKHSLSENSRYYYTLGSSLDHEKNFEAAFSCMEKSLELALKNQNKVDICYALSGLVIVYTHQGKLDLAIKEINNLKVFFQKIELKDLSISIDIAYGYILRQKGLVKESLDVFWQAYSKVGEVKNLYRNTYLLYALGTTYLQLKDKETASLFLTLAQSSGDKVNLKRTNSLISSHIKSIGLKHRTEFDLILDCHSRQIKEKDKGVVNLKGQFVILELLKLFLSKPGHSFSKKELVKRVWDQNYSPSIHDNKVYVTLKRLKKIIEPDAKIAKYILRNKDGYYLNSKVKTFIREIQF